MKKRRLEIAALALLIALVGVDRPQVDMPSMSIALGTVELRDVGTLADAARLGVQAAAGWVIARL